MQYYNQFSREEKKNGTLCLMWDNILLSILYCQY